MEKELLIEEVKAGKSTWQIAKSTGKAQTTIRYWLKKHGLKTNKIVPHLCKCGESQIDNFYGESKSLCKKCHNDNRKKVFEKTRKKIVAHKGGKCKVCDYDKYIGALELHHIDPTEKDPNFQSINGWSWDRIVKEIDKCMLVCGNCHCEVHAGIIKI